MKVTVKRISVGSAFKLGAVISILMWAIFGLLFLALPSLISFNIFTSSGYSSFPFDPFSGGMASMFFVYVCGAAVYGIAGGIGAAVSAFLYNLVAGFIGGLEVELNRASADLMDKPKRAPDDFTLG